MIYIFLLCLAHTICSTYTFVFIYLFIYLIYLSIYLPIYLCIYSFIHLFCFILFFQLTLTATTLILVYVLPLVDSVEDVSDEVLTAAQFLEDANFNNSVNLSQIILTVYDITRSSIYGAAGKIQVPPSYSNILLSNQTCLELT